MFKHPALFGACGLANFMCIDIVSVAMVLLKLIRPDTFSQMMDTTCAQSSQPKVYSTQVQNTAVLVRIGLDRDAPDG